MSEHNIHLSETPTKGKFYLGDEHDSQAEMTFSKAGEQMIIIDHTEVKESLQGQGIGRRLLDKVVALARERKLKIMPLCPYAKHVFEEDESIRDVLRS